MPLCEYGLWPLIVAIRWSKEFDVALKLSISSTCTWILHLTDFTFNFRLKWSFSSEKSFNFHALLHVTALLGKYQLWQKVFSFYALRIKHWTIIFFFFFFSRPKSDVNNTKAETQLKWTRSILITTLNSKRCSHSWTLI